MYSILYDDFYGELVLISVDCFILLVVTVEI